jgi:hypothetical protein
MLAESLQSIQPNTYQPRNPTQSLIFRVIQNHFKGFVQDRESEGRFLPAHILREFEAFMKCGVLAYGLLRLKCEQCPHEKLVAFSCKRRGFCSSCGARRMSEQAAFLTDWVFPRAPVRQWVVSFPMPLRFWMARDSRLLTTVLGIVIRVISGHQRRQAQAQEFNRGESGSVTLVQRFGGSANLNIHFHTLMIEGAYRIEKEAKDLEYRRLKPPTDEAVHKVLTLIQKRVVRALVKRGYLSSENAEGGSNDQFNSRGDDPELTELCHGASIQNKIALGPRAGERVRKVGSFGLSGEPILQTGPRCASLGGFSLHANTFVEAGENDRLEKLCRYVARPPIAEMRLQETRDGNILYRFKKEWSDGTQAVLFSPEEFIEKLVALIPPPRNHLTRYHGVLAPHHRLRSHVVPPPPELVGEDPNSGGESENQSNPKARDPRRLRWAELLKRVFQIDLTTCPDCGGTLKFIAAILDPNVIGQILTHLNLPSVPPTFHPARPPPQAELWD